jgi:hypothetical protein
MAADNNDDCTSTSIAHVLSEVNDFIDALDREEVSVRGDDGDANPIPRSLMIENTNVLIADHRHSYGNNDIVYGDDENDIHDSKELISSLSSRYQKMMNLESSVEQQLDTAPNSNVQIINDGKTIRMEIYPNLMREKEQLEYDIGSVRQKSSGGKIDVIDFNGVAGRAAEVKHRSVLNIGSDSPITDILTDSSIGHSAGESTKNSVASCVENMPPSQRLHSHSTTTAPVSHLEKQPQPEGQMLQTTQLSDAQMVKNKSNSMRIEKNDNLSPRRNSAATMSSSMTRIRSPFSSKSHHLIRTNDKRISHIDDEKLSFSLQNCRKVSLLLKVTFVSENAEEDQVDDDGYGPILFPAHVGSAEEAEDNGVITTIWTGDNAKQSQMRHGEVILVNPKAFEVGGDEANYKMGRTGETLKDRITGRVTVDTAKLVAEVVSRNCVWY